MIERRCYTCQTCGAESEIEMEQLEDGTRRCLHFNARYKFEALMRPPHQCGVRLGLVPPEVDSHPTMRRLE